MSASSACLPPLLPACRLNRVVALMGDTLGDLRLAIAGTIALSDELLDTLDSLFLSRVPKRWARISWEASGSGSWLAGLLARHDQLHRWLNGGRPRSFWMGAFFNPQGFITAGGRCRAGMQGGIGGWGGRLNAVLATARCCQTSHFIAALATSPCAAPALLPPPPPPLALPCCSQAGGSPQEPVAPGQRGAGLRLHQVLR